MSSRGFHGSPCNTAPVDPDVEGFLALLAARRAPRTVEAYRRDLTAVGTWLGKPVGRASADDLERYLAELRAQGLAGSTIARRLAAVRSFFRHQILIGAREDNPAAEIDPPRRPRRLPRTHRGEAAPYGVYTPLDCSYLSIAPAGR